MHFVICNSFLISLFVAFLVDSRFVIHSFEFLYFNKASSHTLCEDSIDNEIK